MKAALLATYRWQYHQGFTFRDALALVPYLHALGVSHVYASPIFRASPGSLHGYDVADHNEINPEIGTREEFDALVAELHRHGMGFIADFVPNHMGISDPNNEWWMNVLENGPASPYAGYFDVEWHPLKPALENKVLLPILGDQYGRVLERGELRLKYEHGAFKLECPGAVLPIATRTTRPLLQRAAENLGEAPDELHSIITALENLPTRDQTDPARIAERVREKRVIRERLVRLCEMEPEVHQAIQAAVEVWQDGSDPKNLDRLDALISEQPYRLSYWRVAAEEINYRRFFDVNSLAAIRVELPEVFDATHRLLLELFANGSLDGVRIDHIDGLARPAQYLETLRQKIAEATSGNTPGWVFVEKILGAGEKLRSGWQTDGTTGYEFATQAMHVLVDRASERRLTQCYEKFLGDHADYREMVCQSKRLIMQLTMASEVNVLGTMLSRLAEMHRWYRDFTVNALTTAIREVIASFPVYRSYIDPEHPVGDADATVISQAIALARRRNPALERSVFEFIRIVLLPPAENPHPLDEEVRRAFVVKFQQCTGPIMAKGVEDTAFYVYNRLVALNEVGGNPGIYGTPLESFHKQCAARQADWPGNLLATSTHDTKRSEDVRARILALSEMPVEWSQAVRKWHTVNRKHKETLDGVLVPDANEEFFLYQTLLGSWPLQPMNDEERGVYLKRLQEYMTKSLHEAKVNSSWIDPNEAWDKAVEAFVERILTPGSKNRFLTLFEPLAASIAELGAVNSMTQTVLKLTTPGVPDFYQGTEMWDFSLVDPDNRRPVDYVARQHSLQSLASASPANLLANWKDGRIKLFLIKRLLQLRQTSPVLFFSGSYEPLVANGRHAERCLAFRRATPEAGMVVVVPRLTRPLGFPPVGDCWEDTAMDLPDSSASGWRDVFTGRVFARVGAAPLTDLFAELPFAVLVSGDTGA
ncbi:maltooligosyl trehalose synthase [Roseimicrobium gellanilyticum]|uniref:Maltooligosyl trehalose synthase n=1 Tax=Roseimicrobium gellanilyticum TaxID=748857 RepID=A0A366H7I2_9BACT|nr:malto-oligosyltrehalose synthase [Roseimicrobium gellanilyticum]RBP37697.1 maltooligosyl trehalose synthase [Roseimicrobium gellanilyticum]